MLQSSCACLTSSGKLSNVNCLTYSSVATHLLVHIKVVFLSGYFWGYICLSKLKVRKYKLSQIVDNDEILGFIVSFEVNKSTIKQNHYFIDSVNNDIYLLSKQFFFEEFEYIEDNNIDYISDFC